MIPLLVPAGIQGAPAAEGFAMRSLRFDGSSAYCNRTFASVGNRTVWTFSVWFKLAGFGAQMFLFDRFVDANNYSSFYISAAANLVIVNSVATTKTQKISTQVFKDVGAWYHVVISESGTTMHVYVNNVEITSWSTNTGPDASNWYFNTATLHTIGSRTPSTGPFNAYLADLVWIDGTALTPSSFAQMNAMTGKWEPKVNPTAGLTMGTNGFWLSFHDNTSTTTLGRDDAGGARGAATGANDWTLNNFSVAAGVNNDSFVDAPINFADGVNGQGNFCTMSVLVQNAVGAVTDGGLKVAGTSQWFGTAGTIGMTSGKWYWEFTVTTGAANISTGIFHSLDLNFQVTTTVYPGFSVNSYGYHANGNKYNNAAGTAYGATYTTNDVIGVAFDADAGKLFFAKNNTWQASGDPVAGTNAAYTGLTGGLFFPGQGCFTSNDGYANFGQRPFAYTPPTGFKALCTQNLSVPTIVKPNQQFDVKTYTGNGGTQSITGLAFQPSLVWIKSRSAATGHRLTDAVRGVTKSWDTSSTSIEATEATGLTAFNSDGFTLGADADYNTNAATYVAWCWKESAVPGLDIISFTAATSGNQSVAHNLGVVPAMYMVKVTGGGSPSGGLVNHVAMGRTAEYLFISTTAAKGTSAGIWGTGPTTSDVTFLVGGTLIPSQLHICYAFAEVPGFSRFGSYTGNGNADGPFVWCGFRPRFILVKRTDSTSNWSIYDAVRDPYNILTTVLLAEATTVDTAGNTIGDLLSNGFKIRNTATAWNASGGTYIFMAFAESPFKYANAR